MKTFLRLVILNSFILFSSFLFGQDCDTLVLHSGQQILVQYYQDLGTTVHYEKCGQEGDNNYTLSKEKVASIKTAIVPLDKLLIKDSTLLYRAWAYSTNRRTPVKLGYLYAMKDSSVLIYTYKSTSNPKNVSQNISVKNLDQLELQKNTNIGRNMLTGASIGFLTGALIGLIDTRSYSNSNSKLIISPEGIILAYGLIGTLSGTVVGGVISLIRIKIPINGSQSKYNKQKKRLKKLLAY